MFEKVDSKFSLCDMKLKIPEANHHATSQYMLNRKNLEKSDNPLLCLRTRNILSSGEFVRSISG